MAEVNGFIKYYRKILDNPIICKDSEHFAIWSYLLLNATHTEQEKMFNGQKITLKKGQLITSRKSVSDQFNISESKCERVFKLFKNEQMIEQQTCSKNRLITIVKWNDYQSSEQQNEQQLNNKWTTTEQQVDTNNKDKKEKKEKNDKNIKDLSALISFSGDNKELLEALLMFDKMRSEIKKPLTIEAQKVLINKLIKFRDDGEDIIECLKTSVMNSWQSIYPSKKERTFNNQSKTGSRALDMLNELENENE